MKCCDFPKLATERIVVRSPTLVVDSYGGQSMTWTTVATIWAWIRPISAFEQFKEKQLQSQSTHKIIIRYNSLFNDTKVFGAYSITFDGRVYSITGVNNYDRTLKNYGTEYQEVKIIDNGPELLE